MSRECGSCNMCCDLSRVRELNKPRERLCVHWQEGCRCTIYPDRPESCSKFRCLWLDGHFADDLRPDSVRAYAEDKGEYINVVAASSSVNLEGLSRVLQELAKLNKHVLLLRGMSLTYVEMPGVPIPERLQMDWVLV